MESFDYKSKSLRHSRHQHRRENPSFSSTLLDSIYRSIDESEQIETPRQVGELIYYKETMRKKQSTTTTTNTDSSSTKAEDEIMSIRRACLIEKWMEKKAAVANEKGPVRRNSMADFDTRRFMNSSSSSSDSSGAFSSSESESVYGSRSATSSSCYSMQRPKPIRTSMSSTRPETHHQNKQHHESGFVKTKSKALKIYGDLKKVRQPISPGGKLANFLNSIFNGGNGGKKTKINVMDLGSERKTSKSTSASTCSSASSFSRSCLRKTSNSAGGDSAKRSVRFYPVSVILDEDSRPCGHKTLEELKKKTSTTLGCYVMNDDEDEHRRQVEEVARSYLMKNYQSYNQKKSVDDNMEEDEDDDAASYASSDLFELDTAGVEERYREELPVYETTYLDRNRAIANGLIL